MPSPRSRDIQLPIDALRASFASALADGPVVVSAPTGSGKSTQVPRWCPRPVLVVEPRRVACRSLAARVAELEGAELGQQVGYHVRNERRAGDDTEILFVTPGIALRVFDTLDRYGTLVLDEFHERSRDTDLFLALLTRRLRAEVSGTSARPSSAEVSGTSSEVSGTPPAEVSGTSAHHSSAEVSGTPHLVVMSATLAGDRIARHLGGKHLEGEGRLHPVEIRYLADREQLLPDPSGLERRVGRALDQLEEIPGDVLVFLPGKGEIASVGSALGSRQGWDVLELHGGLSLAEQSRIFDIGDRPGRRRRAILSTNVAETSLTVPGIGAVVDGGLVRQTRYLRGRGHLALTPVALDSADQRTGRAGRTGPGVAVRLWSEAAQLEERTPPEIHRESLAPLVLAAAACGVPASELSDLPFLDLPEPRALAAAREELERLGAITRGDGALTDRGRQLFGLPLDPALGALLATADESGDGALLDDMIDLVAALSVDRPMFTGDPRKRFGEPPAADLSDRCDAIALIHAVRSRSDTGGHPRAVAEARSTAQRLRHAFGRPATTGDDTSIDRHRLALAALSADPSRAHVARRRGRRTAWAGGGSEIELARESRANEPPPERQGPPDAPRPAPPLEALVVLDSRAFGVGRSARVLATAVLPVPLRLFLDADLGTDRLGKLAVKKTKGHPVRVTSEVERVYAGKVLDVREETPTGDLARQAVTELFLAGRLFKKSHEVAAERLDAARLALALASSSAVRLGSGPGGPSADVFEYWAGEVRKGLGLEDGAPVPDLPAWVADRVASLGVETGDDVALLSSEDLLPPELPAPLATELDRHFPRRLELPDAVYQLEYDLQKKMVILDQRSGSRREPPPPAFLPRFKGLGVKIRQGQSLRTVRGHF